MLRFIIGAALAVVLPIAASAQSACSYIAFGAVLTAAQWNFCFQAKQDSLGFSALNVAGGVMLGPLITAPSAAATAGFRLPPGAAPTTPTNGDVWTTAAGLFAQINGATVGPFGAGIGAGTSGGVPYYSSNTTLGSSALLSANNPVIGGGAGTAPGVGSRSGNTTTFGTTNGSLVNGHCVSIDSNGNLIDAGGACTTGGGGGTVNAGTASEVAYYVGAGTAVSGLATANNGVLATNGSGVPAVTSTLPTAVQNSISPTNFNYTASGTGGTARTQAAKNADVVSILDYGADPTGVADSTTAIQNAVNAVTAGGTVLVPQSDYTVNGKVTITKPLTLVGSSFSNTSFGVFNTAVTTGTMIAVNANDVTIRGIYINGAGTPTTAKGIVVGDDAIAITDAACTASSGTITSASQANWTSANVGQQIKVANCGSAGITLYAQIVSINSTTSIVVTPTAGATTSGQNASYGFAYTDILIEHVQVINRNIGVHWIDHNRGRMINSTINSAGANAEAMRVENQLNPDSGDDFFTDNTFISNPTTSNTGYVVHHISGGSKYEHNKFLGGGLAKYDFFMDWTLGVSGGSQLQGNSMENCVTSAIFVSPQVTMNSIMIQDNFITCGNPNVVIDDAAPAKLLGGIISGNDFEGGGGVSVSAGQATGLYVQGNQHNTGGGSPGMAATANCGTCTFGPNHFTSGSVSYSIASSTTTVIANDQLMGFANLPSSAANGSQIFVSNGTSGSSPCTGSGGGAMAFRQGNNWKCF